MIKAAAPICALLVLASCATTKGALFKQVLDSTQSTSGTSTVSVSPAATVSQPIGLTVNSTPAGAQVYLNGTYIGDTPLTDANLQAGTYKMRISKIGYYANERWVTIDPTVATTVDAQLKAETGYILVNGAPPDANVEIDDSSAQSGVNEVQVGAHVVTVSLFGYEDWTASVNVQVDQTTTVTPELVEAPFRITGLAASRGVLGPLNPGPLGRVDFTFEVSTRGSGSLEVLDSAGKVIHRVAFPDFTQRKQAASWNGRNAEGAVVPDGAYQVVAQGEGKGAAATVSDRTTVEVRHTAIIAYRSLWSGISGLLYAPSPELLPPGSFQVSSLVVGTAASYGTLFPVQLGLRFAPSDIVEVDAQGSIFAESATTLPYSAGLAAKVLLVRPDQRDGFYAAASVKGNYLSGITSDFMTNFSGISLGLPLAVRLGALGLLADPEVIAAPSAPSYGSTASPLGWTSWGYGRAGIFLDFGSLVTGVSAALRTAPFTQGFRLAEVPLAGGWELHWLLPNSQVVLSGAVLGEYSPTDGYYFMAGAGVGILN